MAKKRRKVFRRQADRSWKELKPRKRKQQRKPTARQIAREGNKIIQWRNMLRPLVREAARAGLVEAIEHCGNFWSVSDGYKRYIDHQIETQAEALMAAVRTAVRDELTRVVLPGTRRKPKP